MKYISKILLLGFFSCSLTYAGIGGLTAHSRANCINNESISWELGTPRMLKTVSIHRHFNEHGFQDKWHLHVRFWANTSRSAAVCWQEGYEGAWTVQGIHWIREGGREYIFKNTFATNCSIANGWGGWIE